jgi:hypothetical protein
MAGLNIDQILRDLERQKTAEEIFAEGLQGAPVEAPVAQPVEEVPAVITEEAAPVAEVASVVEVAEEEKTAEAIETEKLAEMEKEAAELDAKGRIMARAFMSELEKLASAGLDVQVDNALEASEAPVEETEKVAQDSQVWILANLYNNIYNS